MSVIIDKEIYCYLAPHQTGKATEGDYVPCTHGYHRHDHFFSVDSSVKRVEQSTLKGERQ
jgi:hypothetical protein